MIKFVKTHPEAKMPFRANPNDAGADLFSVDDIVIPPLSRALVNTGISIELPNNNVYARIAPRSGLAVKKGIDVLAGVVDNGYRGVIGVVLYNTDQHEPFEIKRGDRIAQLIVEAYYPLDFVEVESLSETIRSDKGFGASGTQ